MDLFGVGGGPSFGATFSLDMCLPGSVCSVCLCATLCLCLCVCVCVRVSLSGVAVVPWRVAVGESAVVCPYLFSA